MTNFKARRYLILKIPLFLHEHIQKTVRCTVAASLHQLATVLGTELTTTELVPIFNGFLSDVDDVRICALAILYNFLQVR